MRKTAFSASGSFGAKLPRRRLGRSELVVPGMALGGAPLGSSEIGDQEAIETRRFGVILTFSNYHPLDTSAADWLLPLAAEHDVGVLNGSPMAHGLLINQDPDKAYAAQPRCPHSVHRLLPAARQFYSWCQEEQIPMATVVFQMCLRQPLIHCTLSGAKSRTELEENLRAATTWLRDMQVCQRDLAAGHQV